MKRIFQISCIWALFLIVGCTGNFEEMNKNPNAAVDVPAYTLLPKIIFESAKLQDNRVPNYFCKFTAQNDYIVEDRYRFPSNDMEAIWNNNYLIILRNSQTIIDKCNFAGSENMKGVGEVINVFGYHTLTDIFGNIPYSESMGGEKDILTPKYDNQKDVYFDLLKRMDVANDLFSASGGKINGDILLKGDYMMWKKFCNSLCLRIAMRMSNVEPTEAKRIVENILGNQAKYPVLLPGENVILTWTGTDPYRNSWYTEYLGGENNSNNAVSETMINYLVNNQDPRLPQYARKTLSNNTYTGAVNGPVKGEEQLRQTVSRVGTFFTNSASFPTKILMYSEVAFCIAEAAEKGWNTGGINAKTAYENGIRYSCKFVSLDDGAINSFIASDKIKYIEGQQTENLKKIYLQKWVSLYLQGLQGWAEARRTDVPLLEPAPGTLFPDKHNRIPFRASWPSTEAGLNKTNNEQARKDAGIVEEKDELWGKQLWWDVRSNVY